MNNICGTKYLGQYVRSFKLAEEGDDSGSLLGEVSAPEIVILGTSFSALTDRYSFAPFVEKISGKSVINLAVTGGGPLTAIQQYTTSEDFKKSKPKFLIWEFLLSNKPDGKSASERGGLLRSSCKSDYRTIKTPFSPGVTSLIKTADLSRYTMADQPAQLILRSDNPAFKSFSILFNYADGRQRAINVDTRRATSMSADYTVALPDDHALLSEVAVLNNDPLTGSISAQVCPSDQTAVTPPSWLGRVAAWFKSFWS